MSIYFIVLVLSVGVAMLWLEMGFVLADRYRRADIGDWAMVGVALLAIGFAIYTALWTVAGREIVVVRPGSLKRRHEMFGIGFDREYDAAYVVNLRAANVADTPQQMPLQGQGRLAFDYGSKTVRLATWVDDPEAAELRHLIAGRLGLPAG